MDRCPKCYRLIAGVTFERRLYGAYTCLKAR
jgi:hypothetical protein